MVTIEALLLTANLAVNGGVLGVVYTVAQRVSRIETFLYYQCPQYCKTKEPKEPQ